MALVSAFQAKVWPTASFSSLMNVVLLENLAQKKVGKRLQIYYRDSFVHL